MNGVRLTGHPAQAQTRHLTRAMLAYSLGVVGRGTRTTEDRMVDVRVDPRMASQTVKCPNCDKGHVHRRGDAHWRFYQCDYCASVWDEGREPDRNNR